MVTIFGLKIGGDRRKKPEPPKPKPVQEQSHRVYQSALGASNVSLGSVTAKMTNASSIRSMPQPGASQANFLTPDAHLLQAFYNPNGPSLASVSMSDLVRTTSNNDAGLHSMKPTISNPNLGIHRNNGSSPNLAAAPAIIPRPATSGRHKAWVYPLDVHFAKPQFTALLVKSPLSMSPNVALETQYCNSSPRLDAGEVSEIHPLPKALHVNKQPAPAIPPRSALRHPPSPPSSVRTQSEKGSSELDRIPVLERPTPFGAGDGRPYSRGSHRNVPTSLKELMAADDFMPTSPISIPTPPPSLPRASNEAGNRASMNEFGEPIIQIVRAKRETMTISAARRRSLEKMIGSMLPPEATESNGRPKTSSGPRVERSRPLKLNTDPYSSVHNGPHSATFAARQRSESPFGRIAQKPGRAGVPTAAVGALGRPSRPNRQGIHRPTADDYGFPSAGTSGDRFDYESPPDSPILPTEGPLASLEPPDSPIMPVSGPLSSHESPNSIMAYSLGSVSSLEPPDSPIIPAEGPLASLQPPDSPILPVRGPLANPFDSSYRAVTIEPPREHLNTSFRFPDWSIRSDGRSGSAASVAPPPTFDELPLAQSVDWPLLAPSMIGHDSPSLPMQVESPFAIPSFSRPWTPTNVRPGTPTGLRSHTPTIARSHTPTIARSVTPTIARSVTPTIVRSHTPTIARSVTPTITRSVTPTNLRSITPVRTTPMKTPKLTIPTGLYGPSPNPRAPPPRPAPEYAMKSSTTISVREHVGTGFI